MKTWAEVAQSEAFKKLSPDQQEAARNQYFDSVVKPQIPAEKYDIVRQQFDASTKAKPEQSVPQKIGHLAGVANTSILKGLSDLPTVAMDAVSYPVRKGAEAILGGPIESFTSLKNRGLDELGNTVGFGATPESNNEKLLAAGATGVGNAMGGIGLGQQLATSAGPVVSAIGKQLAQNPVIQSFSGAGAGVAGESARQEGASPAMQLAASLIGGVGSGLAASGISDLSNIVGRKLSNVMTSNADIENKLAFTLQQDGIDYHALPRGVKDQILSVAKNADDVSAISPEQVKRLADFESLRIKPMQGWVTRDPQQWWFENNLNTVNPNISTRYRDANQTLLKSVNEGVPDASSYGLGNQLRNIVSSYDSALKSNADDLYAAAREMTGRDIPLDPHRFVNNASISLDEQMLGSKLPQDTLNWFQKITGGQEPFDMGTALQRLEAINKRIYSTSDGAEKLALGTVKKNLLDAIDGYGKASGNFPVVEGDQALRQAMLSDAFKDARSAAANRFKFQESNPLIEKILDDKFTAEKLPDMIASMKVDDLRGLASISADRNLPIMGKLKQAAQAYIRDQATNQAETGGTFSTPGLRNALDKIGPEKGRLLFGDDWDKYERALRVAGAINNAPLKPAGSSTMPNALRWLNGVNIPGIPASAKMALALQSKISNAVKVQDALNQSIVMPTVEKDTTNWQKYAPLLLAPAAISNQ